jgi:hypothetical protein
MGKWAFLFQMETNRVGEKKGKGSKAKSECHEEEAVCTQ